MNDLNMICTMKRKCNICVDKYLFSKEMYILNVECWDLLLFKYDKANFSSHWSYGLFSLKKRMEK